MPRKRASGENGEPVQRRQSSRIASMPKSEPEPKRQTTPRQAKSSPKKRKNDSDDIVEVIPIDGETSPVTPKKRGRTPKKPVASPEVISGETASDTNAVEPVPIENNDTPKDEPITVTNNQADDSTKEEVKPVSDAGNDFEVVKKDALPSPNSEEVKTAIEAQGTDGQLLVNYVQVSKEEIPSPNSQEIKQISNQHGDNSNICVKKPVVEEIIKETIVNPGCNGNCGIHSDHDHHDNASTNGVVSEPATDNSAKNGNHDIAIPANVEPSVDSSAPMA